MQRRYGRPWTSQTTLGWTDQDDERNVRPNDSNLAVHSHRARLNEELSAQRGLPFVLRMGANVKHDCDTHGLPI